MTGQEFGVEDGVKQPCLTVKVQQDAVNHTDVDAVPLYGSITIPIDIHHHKDDAHGTEKVHDFRQCPQIVFLLHSKMEFEL